ncbi:signal peptidase I [Arthrobacter mobilis]|uniref:Signal peptidase I n=1 Tax=Arthrobacter mobilis TaxID=2724944 RepID=A0A7X6HGX3_9MICC|nr:signal peptidase I [Arthrobacter mobilis]NKX55427.1 signal peptidase I [Arthrobacter mobilis]
MAAVGLVLATGQAAVVVTHGVSMNPVYHQGDLVVVARAPSYATGEIVAYRMPAGGVVTLHRIIGGDEAGFVLKGDNNQSIDPVKPTAGQIIGRAVLHLPQAGLWLRGLTSPPVLAVIAFALMAGGGTAVARHRRKRRRTAMTRHTATVHGSYAALAALPLPLRLVAALALAAGVLGLALAVPAWTGPLEESGEPRRTDGASMVFSYTADVGKTPAYDGTTATSPDPIFRKITDTVDVHMSYRGEPGALSVAAKLSTPGGWHSTVALAPEERFTGDRHEATVTLDLTALQDRADAAAAATGMPAEPVTIAFMPRIQTDSGKEFQPTLNLNLSPLQLSLPGSSQDLTVTDADTAAGGTPHPRTLGIFGWSMTAGTARILSAVLLLAALAAGTAVVLLARRQTPADEAAAIHRRYASLLVPVHPMPAPAARPLIDVESFATLAKLAERYGLLVLHWTRSGTETFIVQDEAATYRYRTGVHQARPDQLAAPVGPASEASL